MLDDLDRGLIHALRIDGRAPFSRIAAALDVSPQTVARRYRRLRAEASLRVVGLAEPHRAGQAQWMVRLTASPHASQDLAQALARRADTSWVKLASGGTEIVAIINTPASAASGHSLLLHDIPRTAGITTVSAHYLLHTYLGGPTPWSGSVNALNDQQKRRLKPPTPTHAPDRPASTTHPHGADAATRADRPAPTTYPDRGGAATHVDRGGAAGLQASRRTLAESDGDLLTALGLDGRASLAELAAATRWSPATVARRLTDLQASGAIFYDVEINSALLGATTQALLWMAVTPAHLDHVANTLARHDELAFVAATTGPTNLVAHALCPDPSALHQYLTRRLGALDTIRTLETAPVLRTVKASSPIAPAGPPLRRPAP